MVRFLSLVTSLSDFIHSLLHALIQQMFRSLQYKSEWALSLHENFWQMVEKTVKSRIKI